MTFWDKKARKEKLAAGEYGRCVCLPGYEEWGCQNDETGHSVEAQVFNRLLADDRPDAADVVLWAAEWLEDLTLRDDQEPSEEWRDFENKPGRM